MRSYLEEEGVETGARKAEAPLTSRVAATTIGIEGAI